MKLNLRVIGVTQCGDCNAPARHSVYKEGNGSEKAGMFSYYLDLGVRSLSRNVVITGLMILLYLEMTRLPTVYIALGSGLLLMLGQCAALTPARRAAV